MRRTQQGGIPFARLAMAVLPLALSGSAFAATSRTATSPVSSALPTITGTARSGQTLTAENGSWSGSLPIHYAYQWQRCNASGSSCSAIGSATSQNYVASSGDVGRTIRIQVTASNQDGTNQALSGPTGTIAAPGSAPAPIKQPNPSGEAQDGQTVSVDKGSWSGSAPITFTYQWQTCTASNHTCTNIAGATGRSYLVVTGEVGSLLRATVTGTNAVGSSSSFSNLTSVVIAKASSPVNTALPLISGISSVGHTLSASPGAWTGLSTTAFGYQWSRCNTDGTSCASISGATGQSYGVGQVDLGNALRVSVTATNSAGATNAISAALAIKPVVVPKAALNAVLRPNQEVTRPSKTQTGAAGHFSGKLVGKTLTWTLTFTHLSGRVTAAGLNKGLRGKSGPAFKTLCRSCSSPAHGTLTLTASQVDSLLSGQAYVNFHTVRNIPGEIRGQISSA